MLLLPWRDILRQLTTHSVDSDGTLWVTFFSGPGDFGPLFEALDLLVLVAHTEEDAWEHEVKQIWPEKSDHEWWAVLRSRDGPRQIGVELRVYRDWREPAAALLQSLQTGAYVCSAEHQRIRRRLEGEITIRGSTTDNRSGTSRPWLSVRLTSKDKPIDSMHFVEYFTPQNPVHQNDSSLWSQVGFQLNLNFCLATSERLRALHHAAQCGAQVAASVLRLGDDDASSVSTVEAVRWACSPPLSATEESRPVPKAATASRRFK